MVSQECFFKCNKHGKLITGGKSRIDFLISSSITRNGAYHVDLGQQLANDPDLKITFHKTCISSYTSEHIKRYLKRMGSRICPSKAPPIKWRSNHLQFNFEEHCLICDETCMPKNKQNPNRWKEL